MWVLPQLWNGVKDYASSNNKSISVVHEDFCGELLSSNWEIPYQVNRQISSYILREKFAKEFPLARKRLMVNTIQMTDLTTLIQDKLIKRYGSDSGLTLTAIITQNLYLIGKKHEIDIGNPNYFSDDFFSRNYVLTEEAILDKIDFLYQRLGRLPTSREYASAGSSNSLSFLKNHFGSYSHAVTVYVSNKQIR
ncbi:homing endonuclease associated repeat-containing protein [Paenibacillus periandrae]|uniref:homing endonuclease associated repeat-containing protein n=1 Tax=Paenibacillus periandrae TaxID=1761741 RepID=UPI001F092B3C|nr:hypothetical protein [Paenibacillus periandrae]